MFGVPKEADASAVRFFPELNDGTCLGCGACLLVCPVGAIALRARGAESADV
ncbi:4Fe-4S binding protein [Rhizobium sullae]|uniref:4Fe-4S binding protein n=1 Tax=Rhizobium sullae TaxID=50338 RepID=UPI000B35B9C3|nr:4Fe-4S binding protein [Rhizobium sullae]